MSQSTSGDVPEVATLREAYDRTLAEYESVRERLLAGEQSPGLAESGEQLHERAETAWTALSEAMTRAAATPVAVPGVAVQEGNVSISVDDWDLSDDLPTVGASPATAAPGLGETEVLARRPGVRRFVSPPPDPSEPLRKDLLTTRRDSHRPEIGRERKIAGNLPSWDPIPPSEILQPARHA